jgi:hypothetical protein
VSPTRWHPHFAWLPVLDTTGCLRWLEWLQKRYRFERVGPNRFVGIEEYTALTNSLDARGPA